MILGLKIFFPFSHLSYTHTHTHSHVRTKDTEGIKGINHSSIQRVPDFLKFQPQAWLLKQIFL